MSYCRWSTDKFRSDVYAYEAEAGYVIHVKGKHPVNPEIIPNMPWEDLEWWVHLPYEDRMAIIDTWQKEHKEAMEKLVWENINLPYDDKTFGFDTEEEMFECLEDLKEMGYYIPSGICPESAVKEDMIDED